MKNYNDPEMTISMFSVSDVVTTSGVEEDTTKTNIENARAYFASTSVAVGEVLEFN